MGNYERTTRILELRQCKSLFMLSFHSLHLWFPNSLTPAVPAHHCTSSCGTQFRAEVVNEKFLQQLQYLSRKAVMVDLFFKTFIHDITNKTYAQNSDQTNIIGKIEVLNKRYQYALLKMSLTKWTMKTSKKSRD